MRKTIFILLLVFSWPPIFAQVQYDSIVKSNTVPIAQMGDFFYKKKKDYRLYYKDGKLLKIEGRLASDSNKKATMEYIQDNMYTLKNYYNESHSHTIDTIFISGTQLMISNSQYSFSAHDTIGRFLVLCDLSNHQMDGKIFHIDDHFSFFNYCTTQNHIIKNQRLIYHFIIYQKGEYLNKKVLKKMHEFNGSTSNINEYNLGKKKYCFYNIPLLIVW